MPNDTVAEMWTRAIPRQVGLRQKEPWPYQLNKMLDPQQSTGCGCPLCSSRLWEDLNLTTMGSVQAKILSKVVSCSYGSPCSITLMAECLTYLESECLAKMLGSSFWFRIRSQACGHTAAQSSPSYQVPEVPDITTVRANLLLFLLKKGFDSY